MKITLRGDDAALDLLMHLEAGRILAPALRDSADWVRERLQVYPAELSGQRYHRTGDLGDGWRLVGGDFAWHVAYEGPDYMFYVQDRDMQAGIHQGRWTTYQQVAEEGEKRLEEALGRRVKDVVK